MNHTDRSEVRIAVLSFLFVLGAAPCAYANLAIAPMTLPQLIPVLFILFTEAAFLAVILIPHGFRWIRMIFAWIVVSTLSFMLLIVPLLELADAIWVITPDRYVVIFPVVETIVIVSEALILKYFSTREFLRQNSRKPFRLYSAIGYSLLANIVSVVTEILMVVGWVNLAF